MDSSGKPMKGREMPIELVKILEAAKEHYNRSNVWFKMYQENDDNIYWTACTEEEHAACGLLEAYEIMTGRKIHTFEIEKELMAIA